jgi:hypothetical protein
MVSSVPFAITYRAVDGIPAGESLRQVEATSLTLGNLPEGAIAQLPQTRLTRSGFHMPAGPGMSYLVHPAANAFTVMKCPTAGLEAALFGGAAAVALPLEAADFVAIGALVLNRDAGDRLAEQAETGRYKLENQRSADSLTYTGHVAKPPVLDFRRAAPRAAGHHPTA